ncbi:hypothetical protein DMUE_2213 [Dictyocoela muelleri]|nr:hypothetical protein DMUE_2213 [Dictyocoela muelleri]
MYPEFLLTLISALSIQSIYPSLSNIFDSAEKLTKYDKPTIYTIFLFLMFMPIFINAVTVYVFSRYNISTRKFYNICIYIFSGVLGLTIVDLGNVFFNVDKKIKPNLFVLNCIEIFVLVLNSAMSIVVTFVRELVELKTIRKCSILDTDMFMNLIIVFSGGCLLNLVVVIYLIVLMSKSAYDSLILIILDGIFAGIISGFSYFYYYDDIIHRRRRLIVPILNQ